MSSDEPNDQAAAGFAAADEAGASTRSAHDPVDGRAVAGDWQAVGAGRNEGREAGGVESPDEDQGADLDDLRDAMSALSGLSNHDLGLEDLLTRVAAFAVRAIPHAEGAGLTLLEENRRDTIVATAAFVTEIDDIQYRLGQGPCIEAVQTGSTVISTSLGLDNRWPRFRDRVAHLGSRSVISIPLATSAGIVGAMNVYSHEEDAFDNWAAELGSVFAAPAAIAVQNAHILAEAQRLASRLRTAVEIQSTINQAIGILIARSGGTADQARERLLALIDHDPHRLGEIAGRIVDEAARRARAHRTTPSERPS